MILLEGTAALGGSAYALRVQAAPTPDPLAGAQLFEGQARLFLDGVEAPLEGGPLAAGQAVRLELGPAKVFTRVGQGWHHAVLLAWDGVQWAVTASWPFQLDFRPLQVYLYLARIANGNVLATAITKDEAPERALWEWEGGSAEQTWDGARSALDGSPAFVLALPPEAAGTVRVAVYKGMRYGRAEAAIPPLLPAAQGRQVAWRLPFWLPPDRAPQREVLEALAHVLGQPLPGLQDLSPRTASGEALRTYARLFAAPPNPGEEEALLRERLLAIPTGRFATTKDLEAALKAINPYTAVSDRLSVRLGLNRKLDGTWKLDGSVSLGGSTAGDLQAGYYEIVVQDARVPVEWSVREAERLRPAGTKPLWKWVVGKSIARLGAAHAGVRSLALRSDAALELAGRRRLDGSWKLDGGAKLASGMAVRDGPFLL